MWNQNIKLKRQIPLFCNPLQELLEVRGKSQSKGLGFLFITLITLVKDFKTELFHVPILEDPEAPIKNERRMCHSFGQCGLLFGQQLSVRWLVADISADFALFPSATLTWSYCSSTSPARSSFILCL